MSQRKPKFALHYRAPHTLYPLMLRYAALCCVITLMTFFLMNFYVPLGRNTLHKRIFWSHIPVIIFFFLMRYDRFPYAALCGMTFYDFFSYAALCAMTFLLCGMTFNDWGNTQLWRRPSESLCGMTFFH